jgi:hypothetical protein
VSGAVPVSLVLPSLPLSGVLTSCPESPGGVPVSGAVLSGFPVFASGFESVFESA